MMPSKPTGVNPYGASRPCLFLVSVGNQVCDRLYNLLDGLGPLDAISVASIKLLCGKLSSNNGRSIIICHKEAINKVALRLREMAIDNSVDNILDLKFKDAGKAAGLYKIYDVLHDDGWVELYSEFYRKARVSSGSLGAKYNLPSGGGSAADGGGSDDDSSAAGSDQDDGASVGTLAIGWAI